jgi:predicted phosphodiesterase
MTTQSQPRRAFLKQVGRTLTPFCFAWSLEAAMRAALKPVRFGLCADPHQDVMHDADERLRVFIDAAKRERADFVLQLGDFCRPYEKNRGFLKIWEGFPGPRYHTLGNHDNDGGFAWQQVLDFWGLERRYYSFDQGGWHFVVLDGNEKKPTKPAPGYPRFIGAEQLAWLAEDVRKSGAPTLVFSHQSLEDAEGVENRQEVRAVLEKANVSAGWRKVGVCLSGHHHIDFQTQINGIHYLQINSMSYSWLGEKYRHVRYSPEVDQAFPSLKYTAPYKDALFALCLLEPQGRLSLQGVRSEFVGPSPWALGLPEQPGTSRDRDRLVPRLADRKLALDPADL